MFVVSELQEVKRNDGIVSSQCRYASKQPLNKYWYIYFHLVFSSAQLCVLLCRNNFSIQS